MDKTQNQTMAVSLLNTVTIYALCLPFDKSVSLPCLMKIPQRTTDYGPDMDRQVNKVITLGPLLTSSSSDQVRQNHMNTSNRDILSHIMENVRACAVSCASV